MRRNKGYVVLMAVLISFIFARPVFSSEMTLDTLIILMEEQNIAFENEVKDIVMDLTSQEIMPNGLKVKSRIKFISKGKKTKEVVAMEFQEYSGGKKKPYKLTKMAIDDGENKWVFDPAVFRWIPSFEEEVYAVDIVDLMKWQSDLTPEAKLLGEDVIDGNPAYLVDIPGDEEVYTKIWVDQRRLVVLKVEYRDSEGSVTSEIFTDIRKVKKKWDLPFKVETKKDGELLQTLVVNSVKINSGISDQIFIPPKGTIWVEAQALAYRDISPEDEMPSELHDNIIMYPDSEITRVIDARSQGAALIVKFRANVKYKKLYKFFEKSLESNGWRINDSFVAKYRKSGVLSWISAEKDGIAVEITIAGADKKRDFVQGVITYYNARQENAK
ncbi:outer membrane lipoprotein-sorting protein [bacterium]|nr:outer membrane lipoprotein-sorting protein [bacterium]